MRAATHELAGFDAENNLSERVHGIQELAADSGNCQVTDAAKAEAALRREVPGLLRGGETVVMAFTSGGVVHHFTESRDILRRKTPWQKRLPTHQSIPYESVRAFTTGVIEVWPDMKAMLVLYTVLPASPKVTLSICESGSGKSLRIYEVGRLLSKVVLGVEVEVPEGGSSLLQRSSGRWWLGDLLGRMRGDAFEVDAREAEEGLRKSAALLGTGERVLMAFAAKNDHTALLTSRRVVRIRIHDDSFESRIEYMTIPYEAITAFMMGTPGFMDVDATVRIWTDMPALRDVREVLRAGRADLKAIHALLSDKVLGLKTPGGGSLVETEHANPLADIRWHLTMNSWVRQADPAEAEEIARSHGVLQAKEEESVLKAFAVGASAETKGQLYIFTPKRLLLLENAPTQAVYSSIPCRAMRAFSVLMPGRFAEDAHLYIWTGIQPPPPIQQHFWGGLVEVPKECPTNSLGDECMSYLPFTLRGSQADMHEVQELLSALVLGHPPPGPASRPPLGGDDTDHGPRGCATNKSGPVDRGRVEAECRQARVIGVDEAVLLAFRAAKGVHIYTSERLLLVDHRGGFDETRVQYHSLPYSSLRAVSVTSTAGAEDAAFRLRLWTNMPWLPVHELDVPQGRVGLGELMATIGLEITRGQEEGLPQDLLQGAGPAALSFCSAEGGAAGDTAGGEGQGSGSTARAQFLLPGERVLFACSIKHESLFLTTRRVVKAEVSGLRGRRVTHTSIPYGSLGSFKLGASGRSPASPKLKVYMTSASDSELQQVFRAREINASLVSVILTAGVMGSP